MLRKKMKLTNEHETASTANTDFNAYQPYQYHQQTYPKPPSSFSNFYYPYMPPYDNGLSYDVGISRFFPIPPGYIPPGQVSMPPMPQVPQVTVPQMQVPPRSVTSSMMPLQRSIATSESFLQIEQTLNMNLASLQYQHPVSYVYNPVEYAYNAHAAFVRKYCNVEKRVLLLGMNPGPHGMCQTGIPFGNTDVCKEWFNIDMPIGQPPVQCPNKKVVGFEYHRQEISGKRLWTVFKDLCGSADNFFRYSYIHNYCPLAFFDEKGKNITPSDLRGQFKKNLEEHCDRALYSIIQLLKSEIIIAIGSYAEQRVLSCLRNNNPLGTRVVRLPHPSPMAKNNQNWVDKAPGVLRDIGVIQYFTK